MNEIVTAIALGLDLIGSLYEMASKLGTKEEVETLVAKARAERKTQVEKDRKEEFAELGWEKEP